MDDLRSEATWLSVPDGRSDDAVQVFAQSYAGYDLHAPDSDRLRLAVQHVIDVPNGRVSDLSAPTEDLRAALFALARKAAHGWDYTSAITRQPGTGPLLQELRRRQALHPLLSFVPTASGFRPPDREVDAYLEQSLGDVLLLSAMSLKCFDQDRLAWLALTSKAELALRDEWGWRLQCTLPTLSVTREWRRCDLAVLRGTEPVALVEGKAIYGFDALSPATRQKYVSLIAGDLEKCEALAPSVTSLATVLVSTVELPWSPSRTPAVAYASGHRRTIRMGPGAGETAALVMRDALTSLGAVAMVDLGVGTALGASVASTLLVVRPRPSTTSPSPGRSSAASGSGS